MSFKPGQKVTVHIGGIDNDPTGHAGTVEHPKFAGGGAVVNLCGRLVNVPSEWVRPVTPSCPWTYEGTPVPVQFEKNDELRFAFLDIAGWHDETGWKQLDYATDIAPYGPVRLVPEGSEKAEDTTPITGVHILHLAQTDNDLFKATCHCGQWSWARVTRERARDVHDLHLANVGGVSS